MVLALIAPAVGCGESSGTPRADDPSPDGMGSPDAGGDPSVDDPGPSQTCDLATHPNVPVNPEARGPFTVGERSFELQGVKTRIWYPAKAGSESGLEPIRYDIRKQLPPSQIAKIADEEAPFQTCDCFRDLPVADEYGAFPVVAFVHGTAAFATQSLSTVTHWASRGFIVVGADHPGLYLGDLLGLAGGGECMGSFGRNVEGNVKAMLDGLSESKEYEFIRDYADLTRIGIAGHSAGAGAAASMDYDNIKVRISLAGNGSVGDGENALFMAANEDGVASYDGSISAHKSSSVPSRFVGVDNSGHLAFSDLCELENAQGENLMETAQRVGICGASLAGSLFDCDPSFRDQSEVGRTVRYATTVALELGLTCGDESLYDGLLDLPATAELR